MTRERPERGKKQTLQLCETNAGIKKIRAHQELFSLNVITCHIGDINLDDLEDYA